MIKNKNTSNNLIKGKKYFYEIRKNDFIIVVYLGEFEREKTKHEFKNLDYKNGKGPAKIRLKENNWRFLKRLTEIKK